MTRFSRFQHKEAAIGSLLEKQEVHSNVDSVKTLNSSSFQRDVCSCPIFMKVSGQSIYYGLFYELYIYFFRAVKGYGVGVDGWMGGGGEWGCHDALRMMICFQNG